jgi:hypothetical protein
MRHRLYAATLLLLLSAAALAQPLQKTYSIEGVREY